MNTLIHHCEAVLHLRFCDGIMVTCSKVRLYTSNLLVVSYTRARDVTIEKNVKRPFDSPLNLFMYFSVIWPHVSGWVDAREITSSTVNVKTGSLLITTKKPGSLLNFVRCAHDKYDKMKFYVIIMCFVFILIKW